MHSIPRDTDGVNGDAPVGWDHQPGDREDWWYRSRGTSEERTLAEVNQPSSYGRLTDEEKAILQEWIAVALNPARSEGPSSSYGMKHDFDAAGGFYVTNGQFKGAMVIAGHEPLDRCDLNWQFRQLPVKPATSGDMFLYHALPESGTERFKMLARQYRESL